jgi:hypothetical protein
MLLADRGYDADWIRELAIKKAAWANIPPKCSRNKPFFSPRLDATRQGSESHAEICLRYRARTRAVERQGDVAAEVVSNTERETMEDSVDNTVSPVVRSISTNEHAGYHHLVVRI